MKNRMKRIAGPKKKYRIVKINPRESFISDVRDNYIAAFDSLNDVLEGRRAEIEVLRLAVLTRQHVLLVGPPGCAKSLFERPLFALFPEATTYSYQFKKGTQLDEVFGPMDAKEYREHARWHFNTKSMLPEANFAYLDEVYNASDLLLPSMLSILNERRFKNGDTLMECPLITAIGASNFFNNEPELQAFNDRWLFRLRVGYLESSTDFLSMVNKSLNKNPSSISITRPNRPDFKPPVTISMDDLFLLWRAVCSVPITDDVVKFCFTFSKGFTSNTISDRRLLQILQAAQASAFLDGKSILKDPTYLLTAVSAITSEPSIDTQAKCIAAMELMLKDMVYQENEELILMQLKAKMEYLENEVSLMGGRPLKAVEKLAVNVRTNLTLLQSPSMQEIRSTKGVTFLEELRKKVLNLDGVVSQELNVRNAAENAEQKEDAKETEDQDVPF